MARFLLAAGAAVLSAAASASAYTYSVAVSDKGARPVLSIANPPGTGYGPCQCIFNPSYLAATPGVLNQSMLIVRASGCNATYGGAADHLMYAFCDAATATCGDLQPYTLALEEDAEDPRVFFNPEDGYFYLYYFASGPGQNTVYLRKSNDPVNASSWELVVAQLPWHRNGCVILRPGNPAGHLVIYGESGGPTKGPLPGIGIASTTDWKNYTVVNSEWLEPLGANNTEEPEIVLEAASNVVQLSTGDWLHIYAAGTPGWVPEGNYTGGFIILDKDDPTQIIQRSTQHVFLPTEIYEIGYPDDPYPVQRNRTLFVTSLIPIDGQVDTYRVFYGAADANVATAVLTVTHQ
jgi:predicted GH43/DUF377 family glycosyl hydrolase